LKVLVTYGRAGEEGVKIMRDAGLDIVYATREQVPQMIKDADALMTNSAPRALIESAPKLKIIARPGVGVENIDTVAATEKGIYVTFCGDTRTEAVAEQAVCLIHAVVRNLRRSMETVAAGKGLGEFMSSTISGNLYELKGKVLGVVAFGRIGRRVAEIMKAAYNMKILAYDPYIPPEKIKEAGAEPVDLKTLMQQSDIITLHMPLTEKTTHVIGENEIALMKKTAYIVNTGRGKTIDEKALIKALEDKKIAGAGMDVLEDEPVKLDNPLIKMNNVILTPHSAGESMESQRDIWITCATDVTEVLVNKKKPKWIVNTEVLMKK
jgi:D-3-phosphoglycerate dehydrogenase